MGKRTCGRAGRGCRKSASSDYHCRRHRERRHCRDSSRTANMNTVSSTAALFVALQHTNPLEYEASVLAALRQGPAVEVALLRGRLLQGRRDAEIVLPLEPPVEGRHLQAANRNLRDKVRGVFAYPARHEDHSPGGVMGHGNDLRAEVSFGPAPHGRLTSPSWNRGTPEGPRPAATSEGAHLGKIGLRAVARERPRSLL